MTDVLVAHSSRSSNRCFLSHWRFFATRSRPVPRSVVLDVLALFSWRCLDRADDLPALGRCRGVPVHSGLQYPKSRFTSPGFVLITRSSSSCGQWFLTHWRYPQSALGRWCLWQYALQQQSLPTGGHSQPQGGSSSLKSSALLYKLEVVPNIPKVH